MPPTDMVKKLSRTDPLALGFNEFLKTQGIISKGDEDVLANPMPYTSTIPLAMEAREVRFYQCFASSICVPFKALATKDGREIRYSENIITFRESAEYVIERDILHIFNLNNSIIQIITRSRLEKIKLLDITLRGRYMLGIDRGIHEIRGVYALSLYSSNTRVLSLASLEPVVVELVRNHIVKLFIPRTDLLLVASKPYIQLLRDVFIHNNVIIIKGSIRSSQALIEILDPITLVQPQSFDYGCVDMILLNPEDIDYNAMVKVYGYIDEVIIDNLTRFRPRHNILRIALSAFARSRLKLCISTYMPKRADISYKLKMFEQASL